VSGRSGSNEAELACGRLDVPARARYWPSAAIGHAGALISLELSNEAPPPTVPPTSARR